MLKKFKYFIAVFRGEIVEVPVGLKDKTKVAEWYSETQLQSSVHKSNDKRFDDMKKIIDKRFDDMEEKFDLKFNLIVENISKSDKTNKGFFITVIAVIITLIIVLIISKYLNWLFWI